MTYCASLRERGIASRVDIEASTRLGGAHETHVLPRSNARIAPITMDQHIQRNNVCWQELQGPLFLRDWKYEALKTFAWDGTPLIFSPRHRCSASKARLQLTVTALKSDRVEDGRSMQNVTSLWTLLVYATQQYASTRWLYFLFQVYHRIRHWMSPFGAEQGSLTQMTT